MIVEFSLVFWNENPLTTNLAFPALSSPKQSQFQIWNNECWQRCSAKQCCKPRLQNETHHKRKSDNHLGTRFRVFGRVLKWKSRRPTLHFQLYLHQNNLNFKSERTNVDNVAVRRMLQGRLQNKRTDKRKSTTIWEPDFEFSVMFWSENPDDQLCISSSIFTKTISISNLKRRMLTALQLRIAIVAWPRRSERNAPQVETRQPWFTTMIVEFPLVARFEMKIQAWPILHSQLLSLSKTISISNLKLTNVFVTALQLRSNVGRLKTFRTKRTTRGNSTTWFGNHDCRVPLVVVFWNENPPWPTIAFRSSIFTKTIVNFKSEIDECFDNVAVRRMLQGRLQNETHHKRKSTTIWEPDFEFSVVFWNENPGDQLCISSSIFTKTISISNLKQRMLTTLQCQECCKVDFRTKRTTRGNRQPFGNQISSFRSCFEVKIQATNFAFPALSSPKQSQFQIWKDECWQRCSAKNIAW